MKQFKIYKQKFQSNNYLFSEDYLRYNIALLLFNKPLLNQQKIYQELVLANPQMQKKLNYSQLKNFLVANFIKKEKNKFVNELVNQQVLLRLHRQQKCFSLDQQQIDKLLSRATQSYQSGDFNNLFMCSLFIINYQLITDQSVLNSVCFNTLIKADTLVKQLQASLTLVAPQFQNLELAHLIENENIITYLAIFNIKSIGDLLTFKPQILFSLLANYNQYLLLFLQELNANFINSLKAKIATAFVLDEPMNTILTYRNNWQNGAEATLQQLSDKLNITRERVRQIEKRGKETIISQSQNIIPLITILFKILAKNQNYINIETIAAEMGEQKIADQIIFIIKNTNDFWLRYDKSTGLIFAHKNICVDEIVDKVLKGLPDIILESNINDSFKRSLIAKYYNKQNEKYIKKGLPKSKFITTIIDEFFPAGFRLSAKSDYQKFLHEYKNRYQESSDNITKGKIISAISNADYCLIDRGTYLNAKFCQYLYPDLLKKIKNYLIANGPIIYYNCIFEDFKPELKANNIGNWFKLKGILDKEINNFVSTKRDYINIGSKDLSGNTMIVNYMKSFLTTFSITDLKRKFNGVKEYVFYNIIYKEKDLICLSDRKFIYVKNLALTSTIITGLKKFLQDALKMLSLNTITANRLYSRLKLKNANLLNQLPYIKSQFELFSLYKALFYRDFHFKRPLISVKPIAISTTDDIIVSYARSLARFNKKIIDQYASKLKIRKISDYSKFMNELAADYTQISVDVMVKKDLLAISPSLIKAVDKVLSNIIEKEKQIDTSVYRNYYIFPRCQIIWGKYSLKGFINTFLNDKYTILTTNKFYNKTDFIITVKNCICNFSYITKK